MTRTRIKLISFSLRANALPKFYLSEKAGMSSLRNNFFHLSMFTVEGVEYSYFLHCSSLKNLVKDFQDLSEICLLLLHLEVRVHCFYFLLPVARQVSQSSLLMSETLQHIPKLHKIMKMSI